jgi:hypothetical protein
MTRPVAVACIARLIECVLPRDLSEVVIGDLYEEFELRTQSTQRKRAVTWFVFQAVRSIPRLLLLSVKRWSWLKSLGVAVVAFVVLDRLEPLVRRWLANNFEPNVTQQIVLSLLIGFAACACGGFLSTWMQRGSAWIYSVIGSSFIVSAIVQVETYERLWMLTAFLAIAIVAPIIGAVGFISFVNQWQKRRRS